MTRLIPLEDHIIVKPLVQESTTKSGIILPENKEKPSKGEVVAVGAGKILENGSRASVDVKVGDIVYFAKYSIDELEIDEDGEKKKYLVMKQNYIMAKEA
ncbi:co-chaperone GroES [SR1 bacterium human oral taxon HOT-345]|jgi:chaperonin 10 Kd subunit|nr:co-chaperone GroES [SR1 bacterium human oral taxon HOT-345]